MQTAITLIDKLYHRGWIGYTHKRGWICYCYNCGIREDNMTTISVAYQSAAKHCRLPRR